MTRHLSGIQPSGSPHLGNYFGALQQHVEISKRADPSKLDALFFIADLHALTTVHDREVLSRSVREVAATYGALGFDFGKAIIFRQSDVPEVCELNWLLATATGKGLLDRAHSFKDKTAKGIEPSMGLFTYPILMAADILAYQSTLIPVGQDQTQHVQMAQDMATHFHTTYKCEVFRRPEPLLSPTPKIPGTDGEKMSKSYSNTIGIFDSGKELKKSIASIKTDSRPPDEKKDPDSVNAYKILELFLNDEEKKGIRGQLEAGQIGYGTLKELLAQRMDAKFGEAREKYQAYLADTNGELEEELMEGAEYARSLAKQTLADCYEAVGMPNAARRMK